MNTRQLRQTFLTFFNERGHTLVPSSSLVPSSDPTLLFTNAGMVQFKDAFLGGNNVFSRAASSQRCVRAGGKHNDLENVGYTARHHTFFEMLGNFSFGDYFKKEAIRFAWDFLTQVLKLPENRLWITVLEGDQESEDIWFNEIGIDRERFSRCGPKDNFWSMGDTGPCGPCSEIFYDHGPKIPGGPPGSPEEDGDRYIEIWNLVFMQFDRAQDGTLTPLPKPSVDTGMGLERIAAVLQGVHSNYEIDIFKNLIHAIAEIAHTEDLQNKSLRVIADHIRACAFLITDGVVPSNEGRGYVLRRICRRAIRHGVQLGLHEPFFYLLVKPLVQEMGDAYPELVKAASQVERFLHQEEVQFARTLEQGLKILENDIASLSGNIISGEMVFKLYDTYGFPADLTADIARERGLSIDMSGFNVAMEAQRTRAREASQFSVGQSVHIEVDHTTDFIGYESLEEHVKVVALYGENKTVTELKPGETGSVVLEKTPFYAEAGGQVGDQGELSFVEGKFEVQNTKKSGEAHLHLGVLKSGVLKVGEIVTAKVDKQKRLATELNHSATHLLQAALKAILGSHVQQKGSLVEPLRLRFDFVHFEPLNIAQIRAIEQLVNEKIWENTEAVTEVLPVEEALKSGAVALFGEKYGKEVRVLHMANDFSIELCGGTHVGRTGDIGLFKIVSESGVAAGIRRIEALTGKAALIWLEEMQASLYDTAKGLNCNWGELPDKAQQLTTRNRSLEKELQQIKKEMLSGGAEKGLSLQQKMKEKVQEFNGIKVLASTVPLMDIKTFREMVDNLKHSLGSAVIVLGMVNEDNRVNLVAGVTPNCIDVIQAGKLVGMLAEQVGGKGGGRSEMAEAGGNQPENLEAALSSVYKWVEEKVKKGTSAPKERIRN